jgi:hypothetical protein
MAAPVNQTGDLLDENGTEFKLIQLIVRAGVAEVRTRGQAMPLLQRGEVDKVVQRQPDRRTNVTAVIFTDGSEWVLTRKARPCNCGK